MEDMGVEEETDESERVEEEEGLGGRENEELGELEE
jgi:hypothetical protein